MEKLKEGKRIVAVRFVFQRKSEDELRTARGEMIGKPLEIPFPPQQKEALANRTETDRDRLFNRFHGDVVQKLGVTPSVFLELLDGCTEEQVEQAIRVTRRAKSQNQIKASVAGFFVHALKSGYTDPQEEAQKRKLVEERQKSLREEIRSKLETLKEELAGRVNEKIRELTSANPELTMQAIQALYQNPISKTVIDEQEKAALRPLGIEDFRQDRILREMVKAKIVDLERPVFAELFEEYEQMVEALRRLYPS